MDELERSIGDLVIANRILAKEEVVDAYGHVSIRHPIKPDHYLLSRSLSPEFVTRDDIIEFKLDGTPVSDTRPAYLERYIHAPKSWTEYLNLLGLEHLLEAAKGGRRVSNA